MGAWMIIDNTMKAYKWSPKLQKNTKVIFYLMSFIFGIKAN